MATNRQQQQAATLEEPDDQDDQPEKEDTGKLKKRDRQLGHLKEIEKTLLDLYPKIDKAFLDSAPRINDQMDYWDIYNCDLSENQQYQGRAQGFAPLIADAIDARVTRFTNQIFPASGHNVEVVTPDTDLPFDWMALMEHYIEADHLRDLVIPALLKNGDIEGQWNLYVSWDKSERTVIYKVRKGPEMEEGVSLTIDEAGEEIEDIQEEEIKANRPYVEVIPDSDVMVLPQVADTIDQALAMGGSVTILRRWSKAMVQQMIDDGTFIESVGEQLLEAMDQNKSLTDAAKKHVDSAGITSAGKYCLGYEVWTNLKVDGERKLCVAYFGRSDMILGVKENPYWCNLCPLLSAPVRKVSKAFKGVPIVKKAAQLQYLANDWLNQGADSATYTLAPIVMTDPMRNPRYGSMTLDVSAIWEVDPSSTKIVEFPKLWQDAFELIGAIKQQIFQSLSVNPSMIPGQTGGKSKKLSQAEMANEQVVDILTTADVVGALEASILTPMLQRFAWYDAQFRDEEITVKAYGRAGMKAAMQVIPPVQMDTRYWFKWLGVEAARNAQQMQQQIATMNVLNGIPPQKYPGRRLDFVPLIERVVENTFGARLAPLIFSSLEDMLSMDADQEDKLLADGFDQPVSPLDDDLKHIQIHQQSMQQNGDPTGVFRVHIMKHVQQLQAKNAQQQQQMMQGAPGKPGGAGPGVAGTPRPGAMPEGPRQMKQPAGAVHPDSMPLAFPRKM